MEDCNFTEYFTSVIEKYPEIYNYDRAEYKNRDIAEKAWHKIALEVNFSIEQCKQIWSNIRNSYLYYRRHYNCIRKPEKLNSHFSHLAFLQPYLEPKEQIKNLKDDLKRDIKMSQRIKICPPSDSQWKDFMADGSEVENISTDPPIMSTRRKRPSDGYLLEVNSGRKGEEKKEDLENLASECKKSRMCEDDINENEYLLFFKSLLPNLSNFNQRQSLTFKRKVLDLIEEMNTNK